MEPAPLIRSTLIDIHRLRTSGIFPVGEEPSIATLRNWTQQRKIPYHRVGHFVYYNPEEVAAHIHTALRVEPVADLKAVLRTNARKRDHSGLALRLSHGRRVKFRINEFRNPSGSLAYQLYGWLQGVRVRRNFKTRIEAEAEKQLYEIQQLQGQNEQRTAVTRLGNDQLREAEAIFHRLGDRPTGTLSTLVDRAFEQALPKQEFPLAEAIADYLAHRTREYERTVISHAHFQTVCRHMHAFGTYFPKKRLAEMTPDLLLTYIERGQPSLKTYNNRRGLLFTFFKYAFQKDRIEANPVEKTLHYRIAHRRGSAPSLSAEKTANLMRYVETFQNGSLVPYFALCLFAGIRPCFRTGEMSRLQPEHINLQTGVIHLEPSVSKVRRKRLIQIQPNLAAWLHAYPIYRYTIVPRHADETHRQVSAHFELTFDILRHTYISMLIAKFRSVGDAALQAGNSEEVIRKHYLDLRSREEGAAYFSILPSRRPSPEVIARPS